MSWMQWIAEMFGLTVNYILALALIGGGGYLALFMGGSPFGKTWLGKPFIYLGVGLIVLGSGVAIGTYSYWQGLSKGDATCRSEWNAANYEAKIKNLETAAKVNEQAAKDYKGRADELEKQNATRQDQIEEYKTRMEKLNVACRRPTDDDRRRVCALTGNTAPGCRRR